MILKAQDSAISMDRLHSLQEHLARNGFEVLGDSPHDCDLEAEVHRVIGLAAFDDELTHFQLAKYLSGQEELAAIVLLEGTDEDPIYRTLGPSR